MRNAAYRKLSNLLVFQVEAVLISPQSALACSVMIRRWDGDLNLAMFAWTEDDHFVVEIAHNDSRRTD